MALKSDTASPPNGSVNIVSQESGGGDADDLEDGEIFDDDDGPSPTPTAPVPPPPPIIASLAPMDGGKKRGSPLRKGAPRPRKLGKRAREEDRLSGPRLNKLRRKSEEVEKSKEKEINDNIEDGERSSPRDREKDSRDRDWDRPNRGFLEDEDEEDEVRRPRYPVNRRGRSMRGRSRRRDNTCRFYFQGNCQRGADCPFTHGQPQHMKKFDLCKFYMMDCCVKKDKCTFMHSEFPCKFFHLGLKCFSGKKCKFSHGKITPALRAALMRHLDSVPKDRDLLRAMRERERERDRDHRDRSRDKKVERERRRKERAHEERDRDKYCLDFMRAAEARIPSDGEEGSRTPMPSPVNDNNSSDGGLRVSRSPEKEHRLSPDRRKDKGKRHKERRKHKEREKDIEKEKEKEWEREREVEWEREREKEREWEREGERERSQEVELQERVERMELDETTETSPMFHVYSLGNQDNQPYLEERQEEGELEELIPLNLPKKQRELYLRIQHQQREAENIQNEDGEVEREEDYKEEDWYSSEDEEGGGSKKMEPLATILNSLKQPSLPEPAPTITPSPSLSVPQVLPDIDINAVTKLLCSVRETIQQQQSQSGAGASAVYPAMSENPRSTLLPLPPLVSNLVTEAASDKKRGRDPRLRGNSSEDDSDHRPGPPLHHGDVDLRQLPFKPAPSHSPANEIEASSTSHPPVLYRLRPILVSLPDYSDISLKNVQNKNDPRLRKYLLGGLSMHQQQTSLLPPQPVAALLPTPLSPGGGVRPMLGEVRDPRQRALLANDPRRKSSVLLQQQRVDSDLRQQPPPQPQPPYFGDVDLRMHQPTPQFAFK